MISGGSEIALQKPLERLRSFISGENSHPSSSYERIMELNRKTEKSIDVYLSHIFNTRKIDPAKKEQFLQAIDLVIEVQPSVQKKPSRTEPDAVKGVLTNNKRVDFFSFTKSADKEFDIGELSEAQKDQIKKNLMREFIIKGLECVPALRNKDHYIYSPYFEEAQLGTTILDTAPHPEVEAKEILVEMKKYGTDVTRDYYRALNEVTKAKNKTQIDAAVERWSPFLTNDTVLYNFRKNAEKKSKIVRARDPLEGPIKENSAEQFYKKFTDTWEYVIDYCTPDSMKGLLAEAPKSLLKRLFESRETMSAFMRRMADSNRLRKWFWQLRLGRDVKQFVEKEAANTDESTDFKHYQESTIDKMLYSEAAGFDCTTSIESTSRALSPSKVILNTIESLMMYEKNANLKQKENMKFTVFFGEGAYAKISIPTMFSTKEYLQKQIQTALEHAEIKKIELSALKRAQLKYTSYSLKRMKDPLYRHYYGYEDGLTGDYIIQVKNHQGKLVNDENHPQSLFAVDSHKAAVLIDMRGGYKVDGKNHEKVRIRYNHRKYDGLPAKKHFTQVVNSLESVGLAGPSVTSIDSELHFENSPQYDGNEYPQLDGRATYVDGGSYKKITVHTKEGKDIVVSPTLARALVLAMANDVDYFQLLYGQDPKNAEADKKEYLEMYKDFFSDVQPAVISFNHFKQVYDAWYAKKSGRPEPRQQRTLNELAYQLVKKKKSAKEMQPQNKIADWTGRLASAIERAKEGNSDTAVFASIPGSHESLLYKMGLAFNEGAKLLRNCQGMISPMPDTQATLKRNIFFYTAQSDAYNPNTIDLENPEKNMGVIGYAQEGKTGNPIYTVRKFPGQAQVQFRDAIVNDLLKSDIDPNHQHQTLKEVTRVIKAWDDLYRGKSSLASYETVRNQVFERLKNGDMCGENALANVSMQGGIRDQNGFQRYLNKILNASAKSTFDEKKIQDTRTNLYSFFSDMGAKIG